MRQFRLLHPADISSDLWRDLATLRNLDARYDDPFFDPDFARLVSEVREDTRIGIAEDNGDLIGFWALHERSGRWARPIGGPFSDWHAPVVHPDTHICPGEFLTGLDLSGLTGFGFKPSLTCQYARMSRIGANMADLSAGWDDYIATQEHYWPKHFKKLRRVYRKTEREFSETQYIWDDRSDAHFDRLISMKRAQYNATGLHDVLKAEWARKLVDRLRHFEGARLRTRQSTLMFDGAFAASEFNLQSDTVLHGWLVGFDTQFGPYSPGYMLIQEVLQSMCRDGLTVYDMGPGQDDYKRNYTNMQMPIEIGVIPGSSASLSPMRVFGKLWREGEEILPESLATSMARLRRRTDQIVLSETEFDARVSGLITAFHKRGFKAAN